jgi:hypothetical protein
LFLIILNKKNMKLSFIKKSLYITGVAFSLYSCGAPKSSIKSNVDYTLLANEIKPPVSKPCFEGAYYHKLVSSTDYWTGISGSVVLPTIKFDKGRENPKKPGQYLDNPSIYLGGSMGDQETDIGLAWEVIKDEKGQVSKERKAYRPFLRRTGHASGQIAVFENGPATKDFYWYPGEEVYMSIKVVSAKRLKFVVEGAGKKFEKEFDCDGYNFNDKGEFKRVNAIDQVANEGKPVKPTKTIVENAIWKRTDLYRIIDGKVQTVPLHKLRFTEMNCPSNKYFLIKTDKKSEQVGGEILTINGNGY